MSRRQPRSTLCPSTTLSRSGTRATLNPAVSLTFLAGRRRHGWGGIRNRGDGHDHLRGGAVVGYVAGGDLDRVRTGIDRKSTRLNSSHANISYAVFCLKKKTV